MAAAITYGRFVELVQGHKRRLGDINKALGVDVANDPYFLELLWLFVGDAAPAPDFDRLDPLMRGHDSVRAQLEAEALRQRAKPSGRPPPLAFNALMVRLASYHAAWTGVKLRIDAVKRELLDGVPPADVAARHGISVEDIEQQFAPYIVPAWPMPASAAPADEQSKAAASLPLLDAAPGFFRLAAAVTPCFTTSKRSCAFWNRSCGSSCRRRTKRATPAFANGCGGSGYVNLDVNCSFSAPRIDRQPLLPLVVEAKQRDRRLDRSLDRSRLGHRLYVAEMLHLLPPDQVDKPAPRSATGRVVKPEIQPCHRQRRGLKAARWLHILRTVADRLCVRSTLFRPITIPNSMLSRPSDLVDFNSPPVTEVVLGVQFNRLERFMSPHLGAVWSEFKEDFPIAEEHPYLPPTFETFGTAAAFMIPSVNFQIVTRPEMSRVHFLNREKTQLLQVQRDRFLHNWRKIGSDDDYPRFEQMIETFRSGFRKFMDVVDRQELGDVVPNQCEVSYFNQVPIADGETIWSQFALTFPDRAGNATIEGLDTPEDARFALRYIMPAVDGSSLGRVIIAAEPALRVDGVPIIQFTLTARGKPATANMEGVLEFLKNGRVLLNRAFKKLTGAEMQSRWGRKQ